MLGNMEGKSLRTFFIVASSSIFNVIVYGIGLTFYLPFDCFVSWVKFHGANCLLSRNEQDHPSSHKLYMRHGTLTDNFIL